MKAHWFQLKVEFVVMTKRDSPSEAEAVPDQRSCLNMISCFLNVNAVSGFCYPLRGMRVNKNIKHEKTKRKVGGVRKIETMPRPSSNKRNWIHYAATLALPELFLNRIRLGCNVFDACVRNCMLSTDTDTSKT